MTTIIFFLLQVILIVCNSLNCRNIEFVSLSYSFSYIFKCIVYIVVIEKLQKEIKNINNQINR